MSSQSMSAKFSDFPEAFRGQKFRPGDPGFEDARYIFNMRWRGEDPALIVRPADPEDLAVVMRYASANGIPVGVRAGGHGVDGSAMPADQLVIDLSQHVDIDFDPATRKMRIGGGALLAHLDRVCEDNSVIVPAGTVSNTGVAGLTLGGGVGYNMRRYGATVDNLLSCDVVTTDGRILKASRTENPDLFWALCGAGFNFAIVTRFEFQAQPFQPIVGAGVVLHHLKDAGAVLKELRHFMKKAPRELCVIGALVPTPPVPGIPPEYYGVYQLSLLTVYTGPLENLDKVIGELASIGTPAAVAVQPMPWTIVNSMLDAAAPYGRRVHTRGCYFSTLTDQIVEIVVRNAENAPPPTVPGPSTVQNVWFMGGAISEDFEEDSVAFSREGAEIFWECVSQWDDPKFDESYTAWVDQSAEALWPLIRGNGYVNLTTDRGPEWLSRLYGRPEKFQRLLEIKSKWDPQNLLRFNKNLKVDARD